MNKQLLQELCNDSRIRPFQVQGIRFLHSQYKSNTGAILNDGSKLGKKTQVVLFLRTILRTNSSIKVLIVKPIGNFNTWNELFEKWAPLSGIKECVTFGDLSTCDEIITKMWDFLILDHVRIPTIKQLSHFKCKFKIWLSSENLLSNVTKLYKILNFVTRDSIGKLREFETTYKSDIFDMRKIQILDMFTERWMLRRTADILEDELPFTDEQIEETEETIADRSELKADQNSDSIIMIENNSSEEMQQHSKESSQSMIKKSVKRSHSKISTTFVESPSPSKKTHFLNSLFEDESSDSADNLNSDCNQSKFKLLDDIFFN